MSRRWTVLAAGLLLSAGVLVAVALVGLESAKGPAGGETVVGGATVKAQTSGGGSGGSLRALVATVPPTPTNTPTPTPTPRSRIFTPPTRTPTPIPTSALAPIPATQPPENTPGPTLTPTPAPGPTPTLWVYMEECRSLASLSGVSGGGKLVSHGEEVTIMLNVSNPSDLEELSFQVVSTSVPPGRLIDVTYKGVKLVVPSSGEGFMYVVGQ